MGQWLSADRIPLVGAGSFRVSCADLMISSASSDDAGIFMRVFYPVDIEDPPATSSTHPPWLERKEYLHGLASFLKQSQRTLQFFSDWVVGDKKCAASWHLPLAGSQLAGHVAQSSSLPNLSSPSSSSHPLTSSRSLLSTAQPTFPVVIFSHGLAGCRHFYSSFCASVASYGYVVAAIEHRDYSACWTYNLIPDPLSGRTKERELTMKLLESGDKELKMRRQQMGKRVTECVKALHVLEELNLGKLDLNSVLVGQDFAWSSFKDRLNVSKAAIAGHSFGGATALAATAFSTDFQAAIVLDGWMFPMEGDHYERAVQPTLFMSAAKWQWKTNVESMLRFKNDVAERVFFSLHNGCGHQAFTDFPFLVSPFLSRRMGLAGEDDPTTVMEALVELSVSFMRRVHDNERAVEVMQTVAQKYGTLLTNAPPQFSSL